MANLSPMMQQYFEMKKQNPDTILFFRLGDFYEMFFDDAKLVSRELDLTLTGRDCGQEERAPMCGVPFHSYETYVARLVQKGYKVAICEQMEDPAKAKGLVKRDIIRVITPGTVLESSMLDEAKNNYICSVCVREDRAGCCFADISTGEVHGVLLSGHLQEKLTNELSRFSPREILLNPEGLDLKDLPQFIRDRLCASLELLEETEFAAENSVPLVLKQFQKNSLEEMDLEEKEEIAYAAGALLWYLKKTQRTGLERLTELSLYSGAQYMGLDLNARRNLELLETLRTKEKKGSLLWVLDKTKTAMGKRLIRSWIEQPLMSPGQITKRLNAVEELAEDMMLRDSVSGGLSGIHDLERLMSRIVYGSSNAREHRPM